jgi:hypothetical protein
MYPSGNRAGQDTENTPHGDDHDHHRDQHGAGGSSGSGMAVPPTVVVTAMDNGVLILQGRPDGLRVSLTPGRALALRRELATAFGSAERRLGDGQGDIR